MAYNQVKTAQMAAWILSKCGSPMNIMKLMKLLYLSDRVSFEQLGISMTGDRMVSMPYGPVLSATLNVMNGAGPTPQGGWSAWITARASNRLGLKEGCDVQRDDMDELSDAELKIIDEICQQFGRMGSFELSDYTHKHCPEWTDPNGSSIPISYAALFRALGRKEDEAAVLASVVKQDDEIDLAFSRL